jgi:PKD repeat protein
MKRAIPPQRWALLLLCTLLTLHASLLRAQPRCMQIGVGLEGSAYWSTGENPFIDQMKYRGDWITFNATGSSPWDTQLEKQIPLDAHGYPNAGIPHPTTGGPQKVRIVVSANTRVAPGPYVFLYDGDGQFSFYGMTVVASAPGRIEVNLTGTGNVWMHMDFSATAPNHARNFRLVPVAQEQTYAQDIFRPSFLDKVGNFYALRFMDWFHTNNNPLVQWSSRATPQSYRQSDSCGVAYEYAIELCNRTAKHPWVNVPHLADSTYIAEMAQLWHDSLDPALHVYLEYSNETWNWQFQQAQWIIQNTNGYPDHWPLNTLYDPSENFSFNSGKHSAQVFRIWRRVWGADSLRVVRVLGTQAVWPQATAIGNVEGCGRQYDYLSPTWYFGISPTEANAFPAGTTAQTVIDTCRAAFFGPNLANFKMHYAIADTTGGKGVIHYEGGQHISAYGNSSAPAINAFYAAQTHPAMYDLYDDVLDSIRSWGSELAMAFVLGGGNSQYGSWGHITSVDSTPTMANAPKYLALLDNILPQPSAQLGPDIAFCDDTFSFLDPGSGFTSYLWQDNSTQPTLQAFTGGLYTVTVTDAQNCVDSDSILVTVHPVPQPSFTVTTNQLTASFTSTTPNIQAWAYQFGDGGSSILQNPTHTYGMPGQYTTCLSVYDLNGCTANYCDTVLVSLVGTEVPQSAVLEVWPSPAQGAAHVRVPASGPGTLTLTDMRGARLRSWTRTAAQDLELNLQGIAAGTYLLEWTGPEGRLLGKLMVE